MCVMRLVFLWIWSGEAALRAFRLQRYEKKLIPSAEYKKGPCHQEPFRSYVVLMLGRYRYVFYDLLHPIHRVRMHHLMDWSAPFIELERVNHLADAAKDLFHCAETFYVMVDAFFLIPVNQR